MVGVTGFEPTTSSSQNWRATNCATPRYLILKMIILQPLFSFGNPLAVREIFIGLECLKISTAALRFARFFVHRTHSQPHPKLARYQLRYTPKHKRNIKITLELYNTHTGLSRKERIYSVLKLKHHYCKNKTGCGKKL